MCSLNAASDFLSGMQFVPVECTCSRRRRVGPVRVRFSHGYLAPCPLVDFGGHRDGEPCPGDDGGFNRQNRLQRELSGVNEINGGERAAL
jgi:hypothetical protein